MYFSVFTPRSKGADGNLAKKGGMSVPCCKSGGGAQVLSLRLCAEANWICPGDLGRKDAIAKHLHTGNLS